MPPKNFRKKVSARAKVATGKFVKHLAEHIVDDVIGVDDRKEIESIGTHILREFEGKPDLDRERPAKRRKQYRHSHQLRPYKGASKFVSELDQALEFRRKNPVPIIPLSFKGNPAASNTWGGFYTGPSYMKSSKSKKGRGKGKRKYSQKARYTASPRFAPELNYHDTHLALRAVVKSATWTGCVIPPATTLCLNAMVQGSSSSTRVGKRISQKGISVRGALHVTGDASLTGISVPTYVCVAMVLDCNNNHAPTAGPVYPLTGGATGPEIFSSGTNALLGPSAFRSLDTGKRFKMLKRIYIKVTPQTNPQGVAGDLMISEWIQPFSFYVDLGGLITNFNEAGTGLITDIADCALNMWANTSTTANGWSVNVTYNTRLRFTS